MSIKRTLLFLTIGLVFFMSLPAQFYKVYGYQPPEAGEVELVLWNSYIPSSDLEYAYFGQTVGRQGLWAHSIELEYGLSNKLGVAVYFDFEDPKDAGFKFVRTKAIMAHLALFDKGSRPLDIAVYLEYIVHNKNYKKYEELECRLILEKDLGAFRLDLNPIFEKITSGDEVEEGLELNYAVGLYYIPDGDGIMLSKNFIMKPGLEFYGKLGEISDFKVPEQQGHWIFPTIELLIGPRIKWHLGVGLGLTQASDKLTIKSILTYILKI